MLLIKDHPNASEFEIRSKEISRELQINFCCINHINNTINATKSKRSTCLHQTPPMIIFLNQLINKTFILKQNESWCMPKILITLLKI